MSKKGAGGGPRDVGRIDRVREEDIITPPPAPPPVRPHFLRTRWKLIVLVAIAVTAAAWIFAELQPKRYRASAIVAVAPTADVSADVVYRGVEVLQYRTVVATIAALATTALGSPAGKVDGYDVEAVVLPHTDLLRLDVEGADPVRTTEIANRIPALLASHTKTLYRFYEVRLVAPAVPPSEPYSPRASRAIASGIVVGLCLGAAIAWALDRTRFAGR